MMNGVNDSKEVAQSFIDLVNMAKELMDENQQSSVAQELELFQVQEVEVGEVKAESFFGLVLVNHLLQQLI